MSKILIRSIDDKHGELIIITPIYLPNKTYNGDARLALHTGVVELLTNYMKSCGFEGSEEALEVALEDKLSGGLVQVAHALTLRKMCENQPVEEQ